MSYDARPNDPYAGITRLLDWVLQETDSLIARAGNDPQQGSAIAREVYRRLGNAGQDVMAKCLIDTRTLEERLKCQSGQPIE